MNTEGLGKRERKEGGRPPMMCPPPKSWNLSPFAYQTPKVLVPPKARPLSLGP